MRKITCTIISLDYIISQFEKNFRPSNRIIEGKSVKPNLWSMVKLFKHKTTKREMYGPE